MRIYTRTGDDGSTGRLYGGRIPKSHPAAEAYGTVDEAVAALGVARADADDALAAALLDLQRDLFVVGADLATNPDAREKLRPEVSLVTPAMVERLERWIDERTERSPLPREFVVPGAGRVSAALDLARAVVRRAERRAVELREGGAAVNEDALRYLNRLSDLLFVLAREASGGNEAPSRR